MSVAPLPAAANAIPVFRRGAWYDSLDAVHVAASSASLGVAPPVMVAADAKALRASGVRPGPPREERSAILRAALRIFRTGSVRIGERRETFDDFAAAMGAVCGLPRPLVEQWSALLERRLDDFAAGEPEDRVDFRAISLPANTFVCLESALEALLAGSTVWLRPSTREPFAAARFVGALLEAGWPAATLGLYACSHAALKLLTTLADRAIVYGGDDVANEFRDAPHVTVLGPGRARAFVESDSVPLAAAADWAAELIAANAGRFCTNVGTILCAFPPDALAAAIGERLDRMWSEDGSAQARFAGHPRRGDAQRPVAWVRSRMRPGDRIVTRGRVARRATGWTSPPVLVQLADVTDHPLAGLELPFPCAVIASAGSAELDRQSARSRFVHRLRA